MTYTTEHLVSLMTRLSNETERHGNNPKMSSYLESIRREIKGEEDFLKSKGVEVYSVSDVKMTDDELLAELGV